MLAAVALLGVAWSYMLFFSATHQTLDQRVQSVASQLKCPVCQAESVADSPSLLAQQMRAVIRHKLQAGQSEQEIIQYFVNSYGEQIIWSPPWQGFSLLAWLIPIVLMPGGVLLLFVVLRNWKMQSEPTGGSERANIEDDEIEGSEEELKRFHAQLEQELADADILFRRSRTEAR